jgi:4'-phosphopantetheinyl transferase
MHTESSGLDGIGALLGVSVWYVRTNHLTHADVDRFEGTLSLDERKRRDRLEFFRDRRDFVVAHGLTRFALSMYGSRPPEEWRFDTSERGKPFVVEEQAGMPRLAFSLSHTEGVVACAIGRGFSIGIDVERRSRASDEGSLASEFFASEEVALFDATRPSDHAARFLELWTLKEAYVKAVGIGLSIPLSSFAFSFDGDARVSLARPSTSVDWQFVLATLDDDVRLSFAFANAARKDAPVTMLQAGGPFTSAARVLRSSLGVKVILGHTHLYLQSEDRTRCGLSLTDILLRQP